MSIPFPSCKKSLLAAASTVALLSFAGCVVYPAPQGTVLSRLPDNAPASAQPVRPLTPEEKERYDAIDRRALHDQEQAIREDAAIRQAQAVAAAAPPVVYSTWGYPAYGWGYPGWGYPGWGWGRPGVTFSYGTWW